MLGSNQIIDFLTQLRDCRDDSCAWELLLRFLANLGFPETYYGLEFVSERQEERGYIELSNYRKAFLDAYHELGGAENDMAYRWILGHDTTLHWSTEESYTFLTGENMPIEQLSADFNIKYGATIPLKNPSRSLLGGFGLSATDVSEKEYTADILPKLDIAVALVHLFDMYIRSNPCADKQSYAIHSNMEALNPMELETLKWLANGYSIKQIADEKLNRSVESINLYIRGAKEKLNTRTRDQLIARAALLGLI